MALPAFPQDQRLRQHATRRRVAARALPAQRIGADDPRPARAVRTAAEGVLSRLRRLRSGEAGLQIQRRGRRRAEIFPARHRGPGQRQRRPRRPALWHGAVDRRQGVAGGIPQNILRGHMEIFMDRGRYSSVKRKLLFWLGVLVVVGAILGYVGWTKFFREEPQPDWVTASADMRFKYGSIRAEDDGRISAWVFYMFPRMLVAKLPRSGWHACLGAP